MKKYRCYLKLGVKRKGWQKILTALVLIRWVICGCPANPIIPTQKIVTSIKEAMNKSNKEHQEKLNNPAHCGSKPKKIAFGIAPLGYISIGIVPMGIVSIGIVPMGVVSIGVVAMGVINASIVGMGIFSAGITTMGLKVWSPIGPDFETVIDNETISKPQNIYAYSSKEEAIDAAKEIGCEGIHRMGDYWMPCATHGITK